MILEEHEGSKAVKTHQPCPDCGSSDALCYYDDGHTFCFSCETVTRDEDIDNVVQYIPKETGPDKPWFDRKISPAVESHYDVTVTDVAVVFPYHNQDGMAVAKKIRHKGKQFCTDGDF